MVSLVALSEVVGLNDTSARTRITKIFGFMELTLPARPADVSLPGHFAARSSLGVLPGHLFEETCFFELVDETRLDETFGIGVRQIGARPRQ